MIALEEEAKVALKAAEVSQKAAAIASSVADLFLPGVDQLFSIMFDVDDDYLHLKIIAPEVLDEIRETFRTKFVVVVDDLISNAKAHRELKDNEINAFYSEILRTTKKSDSCGKISLNGFLHRKKMYIKSLGRSEETTVSNFREDLEKLVDDLVGLELSCVEQFEDLLKELERAISDIGNSAKEASVAGYTRLRELENEHHEKVTETIQSSVERQNKSDMDEMDDALRDVRTLFCELN
jgi:hypothetical protein